MKTSSLVEKRGVGQDEECREEESFFQRRVGEEGKSKGEL